MKVLGLILAGGKSEKLGPLVYKRASAALPIGGKYRSIDFTLSNMVNSGIIKVGVLTQYNPRSLMDHLGSGKEWDLDRKKGGLFILQPYIGFSGEYWYKGTADAIFQNMTILRRGEEDYVLIGSGDHIYKMNYNDLYLYHFSKGADITLVTKDLDDSYDMREYGSVVVDDNMRILQFHEKVENPPSRKAFLGVYFMNKHLLMELLYSTVPNGGNDLLLDVILPRINELNVYAYDFKGYWRNIKKGVREYFKINMDIVCDRNVRDELFYENGKVYTKIKDFPPAKFTANSSVKNSIVADGCIISGMVENSVIFRGVIVKAGAKVENSIIMQGTVIEEGAVVKNAIMDKDCLIREGQKVIGDFEPVILEKRTTI
ncbi:MULTISPECIES: glucose-1-phosphate adenylyltransferase subunit GlgD [unclassified Thermosipho (in: thermotogales)]|uniref:glucose-1-phosphate adenylyltransferase subunit GlgD n=1 Tax=unclassified Thermosipho (in: thermotogales) TaxID=2676525 RepID=UPI000985D2F1|nr:MULTISPECIES: glucose-1-phosphate adenylyltransferase subunit GlgD [unclassified Thermosipho (in: thermotogales)]MBT1248488.1 glucose-1-phosphate adenylyltransferase [Thermosipho sp. 1244]OOC47259.1 glucose-1-phosphate adenylyltransferase [Thermosipho sp. 1223]